MKIFKLLFFLPLLLLLWTESIAQENPPIAKNDSIILAQAYINLTLTKEYFEGLPVDRIAKILPFEKSELESITDSTFLRDNSALYHFTSALLHFNEAKFQFRTKKETDREALIGWNNSLEKAIEHFNLSKSKSYWDQPNDFFELIKFEEESFTTLHRELFELKSLFTPYFNQDIYPDFQRIFLKAKRADKFEIDSLAYLAALYDFEFSLAIIDKEYDKDNYDYGPNTLGLKSEYDFSERNYDYNPKTKPIQTRYLLDEKLDLISRYVQLKKLASKSNSEKLNGFESYRLFNDYFVFKDASLDKVFINKITQEPDPFLSRGLDSLELDALFSGLRRKFPYAPYATAQSFINLSLVQANFDSLSSSYINSVLAETEIELGDVKDTSFIAQNGELYNFTYALLYENTARLLFRTRENIDRKRLIEWKETLERGIDYFNLSRNERAESEEQMQFHELIKFQESDFQSLIKKIESLKTRFTPYFNEDIYPDFQRIFYKAKNTGEYDFEGLKAFAGIYNLSLDFSILENNRYSYQSYFGIEKEYRLQRRLDLVSKHLQLKYLVSDQFQIPRRFDVELLYMFYNNFIADLQKEKDTFIVRELNPEEIAQVFRELQNKFPIDLPPSPIPAPPPPPYLENQTADGVIDFLDTRLNYFFPELAPLASARLIKPNFKPELKTLGKADEFLRREFIASGYRDQLHYYYASDGFAISTSLERFNLDGSAVPVEKRFVKSLTEQKKLSYYEIIKSMFFDVEYDYRMFAMVISSRAAAMSRNGMTPTFAEKLIENSFNSLPADLTNKELPNKTLSVFVYHFRLNVNNGTVQLDLSGKFSAQSYLKNAGLSKIIE